MRASLLFTINFLLFSSVQNQPLQYPVVNKQNDNTSFVPVDLFVMSKCPDAVFCEQVFNQVLQKVKVPVQLDVNYIAEYNPEEQPYKHICKHGSSECLGNIQQLCYHNTYPQANQWFQFNLCLNRHYKAIGLDNNLAESCSHQLNTSYEPVKQCVQSDFGVGLLIESAQKTKALRVTKSCTIFIDNKLRCIHDGTWKNCEGGYQVEDFIKSINDAYYRHHQ